MNLETKQRSIDLALINELIASTPDSWDEIVLDIRCNTDNQIEIEITGPTTSSERVGASEALTEHVLALTDLLTSHGGVLKSAQYKAQLRPDNAWTFKATFNYF